MTMGNYQYPSLATPGGSYLGQNPNIAYRGAINYLPRSIRDFLSSRYGDIYGEYEGELGQKVLSSPQNIPTKTFYEYLQNYPWLNRYYGYSPYQRGESPSRYSPPARYLMY